MKIILESSKLENLTAKLSSTPAMVNAIITEIDQIHENKRQEEMRGTAHPKLNAMNIGYILEEYLQILSDQLGDLFENAKDFNEGGANDSWENLQNTCGVCVCVKSDTKR